MTSGSKVNEEIELSAFPRKGWIFLAMFVWLLFGCMPLLLILIGTHIFSLADANVAAVAGTIGDAFGLANSFFAAGALLFVIWSIRLQQQEIRFARKEWRENTDSQKKQIEMMKEAADLSAINHIYLHYSEKYGEGDSTRIREGIAAGHRMWAIRESFDRIDKSFSKERIEQASRQLAQLKCILRKMMDRIDPDAFPVIAVHTASILVDHRVPAEKRRILWPLYEILREDSFETIWGNTERASRFERIATEIIAGLEESESPEMSESNKRMQPTG
jgi:hypothetical protein